MRINVISLLIKNEYTNEIREVYLDRYDRNGLHVVSIDDVYNGNFDCYFDNETIERAIALRKYIYDTYSYSDKYDIICDSGYIDEQCRGCSDDNTLYGWTLEGNSIIITSLDVDFVA